MVHSNYANQLFAPTKPAGSFLEIQARFPPSSRSCLETNKKKIMLISFFHLLFLTLQKLIQEMLTNGRGRPPRLVLLNQALKQLNARHFISAVVKISSKVHVCLPLCKTARNYAQKKKKKSAAASSTVRLAVTQLSAWQRMLIHCNECRHWNGNSALHLRTKERVRRKKSLVLRLRRTAWIPLRSSSGSPHIATLQLTRSTRFIFLWVAFGNRNTHQ